MNGIICPFYEIHSEILSEILPEKFFPIWKCIGLPEG